MYAGTFQNERPSTDQTNIILAQNGMSSYRAPSSSQAQPRGQSMLNHSGFGAYNPGPAQPGFMPSPKTGERVPL